MNPFVFSAILTIIGFIIAQIILSIDKDKNKPLSPPKGNILIFDTETNGKPINWKGEFSDLKNWPELISIAWYLIQPDGAIVNEQYFLIRPINSSISLEGERIHNISFQKLEKDGNDLNEVLASFEDDLKNARYLVSHNIGFDYPVVFSEYKRLNLNTTNIENILKICTMTKSKKFYGHRNKYGYKYPKLQELYWKLFSKNDINFHSAKGDAYACMLCLKELYNRKIITF